MTDSLLRDSIARWSDLYKYGINSVICRNGGCSRADSATRAIGFWQTLSLAPVNIGEEFDDFRRFVHEEPHRRNSPEKRNLEGDSLPTARPAGKFTNGDMFFALFRTIME